MNYEVNSGESTWVEDVPSDDEGWVTVDEVSPAQEQSNGLFGLQGGLDFGPLKLSAGVGAGR